MVLRTSPGREKKESLSRLLQLPLPPLDVMLGLVYMVYHSIL